MDSLGRSAMQLQALLEPLTAMIVAKIHPGEDEMSMSRAYEEYGRSWIEGQRSKGNLKVRYKGNRKLVSKADIECLRAAERETPMAIFK